MNKVDREYDEEIEERIEMEIVVDAHDEEERAMGWYYYMADNLKFPFKAKCVKLIDTSPLSLDEVVEVVDTADGASCERSMFLKIKWRGKTLSVPAEQLEGINVDDATDRILNDWAYWIARGYSF